MANLVPEKRMNRNGKLVTKHVRAESPQGSQRPAIPSPQLGATKPKKAAQAVFKPRPAQLEEYYNSYKASAFNVDPRLDPDPRHNSYYGFSANDVEIYTVLAATKRSGDALHMLQVGIRDAAGVKKYLKKHKAMDLYADRDFAQEALTKNIPAFDFISQDEELKPEQRDSPHYVDIIRFKTSSLNQGLNSMADKSIVDGTISFDDIKTIGITKLKSHDALYSLIPSFKAVKRGEADFTVDKIKDLLDRARKEKLKSTDFNYVCRTMDKVGMDAVLNCKELGRLASEFHAYNISPGSSHYKDSGDSVERAVYSATLKSEVRGLMSVYVSDEYYEAGIPVEVAADVMSKGGGIREAKAIHEEGISSSVAGGWL